MIDEIKFCEPGARISCYTDVDTTIYERRRNIVTGAGRLYVIFATHIAVNECDFINRDRYFEAGVICYAYNVVALKRCDMPFDRFINKTNKISNFEFHLIGLSWFFTYFFK